MGLDFSKGGSFDTSHPHNRYPATRVRNGLIDASVYLSGDAIIVPRSTELPKTLGMSTGAIYSRGFETYSKYIEYVTGLHVVQRSGLVLVKDEQAISPLNEHLSKEEEVSENPTDNALNKIIDLAQGLDEATRQKVLDALSNPGS